MKAKGCNHSVMGGSKPPAGDQRFVGMGKKVPTKVVVGHSPQKKAVFRTGKSG